MTHVDRHAYLQQARELAFGATLQLMTGCSEEYNVASAELLSLLIEDLQNALHRPASPLSTSARSVATQASRPHFSIVLRHPCRNQWVCPSVQVCNLCASNPNKRCEPESDLAPKQLEEGSLKTRCGALLQATVCRHEASQEDLPDGPFALDDFNPHDFCIEMSIVSAQNVASLTEAGADLTVEAIRQSCELLTKKNATHMQLLRKSSNSPEDSDNQRVRADFLLGKDLVGLDVRATEGSQRRLSATQKFQLLVVLIRKADDQPIGYTLSNAFQVTTGRAEVDWNADIPCYDAPVNKLRSCGTEITRNLLNVAECCESKGFVPPPHLSINTVRTVQDFCDLYKDICQNWGPVPQAVMHALVPEKAVEHSKKMLPRDFRMRIFMPKDRQHGAMYLCAQAHVDLANSARAVLMSCVITRGTMSIWLPERRSAEQNTMMSKLARQAEAAWQLPGHPGWYAAKCMEDGDTLLDVLRQREAENGVLELRWHALADMLSMDARIFQPSMMHGGAPQLALPQGGGHWGLPPIQQQPPQVPAEHLGQQQPPFMGTSNQAFAQDQAPQVLQAWPDNPAGSGYVLPDDTLLPEAGPPGQFAAGPSAMAEADPFALPSHVTDEPPSASGTLLGPQGQPTGLDPFYSAQANIPTQFPGLLDAGPNMPPQGAPVLHSQDISSHAGSISPGEMRYTASASAHFGSGSPAGSHLSYQSRSGHTQHSTDSSLALLQQQQHLHQQQQQPFAGMRQEFQPPGQAPLGLGLNPGGPELGSVVFSGVPMPGAVRGFAHSQSDRVRRQPPSRNPSFTDAREVKRRNTAPAGSLENTLDHIYNDPYGEQPQGGGGGNKDSQWGLVAAPQQATFWPMGSNNSHQRQRGWAAQTSPSSFHVDLPGLPSLVFADSVHRPVPQHTMVLQHRGVPQYDGAGDLSSEDISFLDEDGVMSLLAPGGLGDDAADSEQQATGPDEVEEIQPQVPYVVFVFLAKRLRALVVKKQRHQLGAVADSLALDSCRKRMWQRAVIARFAKSSHAHAIKATRAASMDLSDLVGGSAHDLWDEAGPQDDSHFLLDMAAEYFN